MSPHHLKLIPQRSFVYSFFFFIVFFKKAVDTGIIEVLYVHCRELLKYLKV